MTHPALTDTHRAALLEALDEQRIDAGTATEVLLAFDAARDLPNLIVLFKLGCVRPTLDQNGALRWLPTSAVTSPGVHPARSTDPHPLADRTGRESAPFNYAVEPHTAACRGRRQESKGAESCSCGMAWTPPPGALVVPVYCRTDSRCILDDQHDGDHVHDLGEVAP